MLLTTTAWSDTKLEKNCKALAVFAESTMRARQSGVSIVDMYQVIENENKINKKIMQNISHDAFESPIYTSQSYAELVPKEFANQIFKVCISPK